MIMRDHSICFSGEIRKIISDVSSIAPLICSSVHECKHIKGSGTLSEHRGQVDILLLLSILRLGHTLVQALILNMFVETVYKYANGFCNREKDFLEKNKKICRCKS